MNEKFVPSMTRKYNTVLIVHAKLSNLEDLSLLLGNHDGDGDKYPSKYLYKKIIHLFNDVKHVYS